VSVSMKGKRIFDLKLFIDRSNILFVLNNFKRHILVKILVFLMKSNWFYF